VDHEAGSIWFIALAEPDGQHRLHGGAERLRGFQVDDGFGRRWQSDGKIGER